MISTRRLTRHRENGTAQAGAGDGARHASPGPGPGPEARSERGEPCTEWGREVDKFRHGIRISKRDSERAIPQPYRLVRVEEIGALEPRIGDGIIRYVVPSRIQPLRFYCPCAFVFIFSQGYCILSSTRIYICIYT